MKTGIFPLLEADRESLTSHLLSLTGTDRYFRFFCRLSDEAIAKHARTVKLSGIYGYFMEGALIAVAYVMPDDDNSVEFAVSVDANWRGHGLGQILLQHCLQTTQADAVDEMVIHHLSDNVAMAGVHRKLRSRTQRHGTEVDVRINLAALREDEMRARELLCAAEL